MILCCFCVCCTFACLLYVQVPRFLASFVRLCATGAAHRRQLDEVVNAQNQELEELRAMVELSCAADAANTASVSRYAPGTAPPLWFNHP
jgi:hypothetical protein